jgi:hypothetical protein
MRRLTLFAMMVASFGSYAGAIEYCVVDKVTQAPNTWANCFDSLAECNYFLLALNGPQDYMCVAKPGR